MVRPAFHKDLPDYQLRGDQLFSWAREVLARPSIAKHLLAAAEAAEKVDLMVTSDGVYERPSTETLDARLKSAQEYWDEQQTKYQTTGDFELPKSDLYSVNSWARREGLTEIKPAPEVKTEAKTD